MDALSDKIAPSHPFTMADVEVMRTMRLRLTRRKFRITIALQCAISLLIMLWIAYLVTMCVGSACTQQKWINDWVILVSILLVVANVTSIAMSVRKYKAARRFLEDPATHPDLIINDEVASFGPSKAISKAVSH
ncbi:hypothetical protein IWW38_004377 [Coemansia aciculifera]|uniref:Uncharacterized protein n=1 Tax=Coemansia aciculifera TaxID=417176 RepID=A0ACC1LYP5_9FUNG|nr:hypothetical protein IWW38_004377 [Coemansia aciculifera]